MKKVLVLNQFALPRSQGGGTRHVDLFGRLQSWTYVILAGNRNYSSQQEVPDELPQFRTVRVSPHAGSLSVRLWGWVQYSIKATVAGLRTGSIDAVYASSPQMLAGVAGWFVAKVKRVPFILEIRDLWPDSLVGTGALSIRSPFFRILQVLERRLYHAADHIVVVTPGWEPHFQDLGVDSLTITVIPNGTDATAFQLTASRDQLRRELGITRPTAVYAGAHGRANALHLLVDAARANPQYDVILVGAGTEKEGLRERARDLPNVRFIDPVPKDDLARILRACDLGVHCLEDLPVLDRGVSPNKIFDYLAADLPFVSNAAGALLQVVRDGDCGRTGGTFELDRLLSEAMSELPKRHDEWVARGREILATGYSRDSASRELEDILDATVQRHKARQRRIVPHTV